MQLILVYFVCFVFLFVFFYSASIFVWSHTLFSLFLSVAHYLGTNSFSHQPTAGVKIKDGSYDLCRENSAQIVISLEITPS